jgi:hypothetical protein
VKGGQMSEDKDFLDRLFYFLGKIVGFIKKPFGIYLTSIILIVMFPPIENSYSKTFFGWGFITDLGSYIRINMIYFLSEIGIVTLVFFAYLFSKKK